MSKGWTTAIQAIGAVAGLGLLATFAGGAMLWLRFDALDLPADRAVALLPKELLVVVGAHALVVPVLVGLVALLLVALMEPLDAQHRPTPGFTWRFLPVVVVAIVFLVGLMCGMDLLAMTVVATVAVVGIGAMWLASRIGKVAQLAPGWRIAALVAIGLAICAAIGWMLDAFAFDSDVDVPVAVAAVIAGFVGALLIFVTARDTDRVAYIALVTFSVFAVLGALVGVGRTYFKPRMEPLAVLLQHDARGLAGFYVGETADRLYLVSLPSNGDPGDPLADAEVDRVVSVPRADVMQLAMREPIGVDKDEPGREQANTLLSDVKQAATTSDPTLVEPVTTANPQVAFAPLVHLHVDEDLMPMSPLGFLDGSVLRWSNVDAGCEDVDVAAGKRRRADVAGDLPGLRYSKLGEIDDEPYAHGPGQPCLPEGAAFAADDHTRPHDGDRDDALGPAQGFYLDLDDDLRGGRGETEAVGPQRYLRNAPVYVEKHATTLGRAELAKVREDAGEVDGALQLTYWFFYGLSRPPGVPDGSQILTHEGDWERISVTVARLDGPTSNRYLPISARYHHHDDARVLPWYAVRRTAGASGESATHPVVYSAKGSHASYWRAGRYETEYRPDGKRLFAVEDDAIACQECPQWQTWLDVRDALGQRWYGFGGAWGDVSAGKDGTGPLGPSKYKVEGLGTPTTETVGRGAPVPSAPPEVQDLVRGDD